MELLKQIEEFNEENLKMIEKSILEDTKKEKIEKKEPIENQPLLQSFYNSTMNYGSIDLKKDEPIKYEEKKGKNISSFFRKKERYVFSFNFTFLKIDFYLLKLNQKLSLQMKELL